MHRLVLLLMALGLAATACGHASSRVEPACCAAAASARVSGMLVGVGGPANAGPQHWAGTIRVRGPAFTTTARTDERGRFWLHLPAGSYRLTATSPSYQGGHAVCVAPHAVRLVANRTAYVHVICQLR